jgi:transposase-like protein
MLVRWYLAYSLSYRDIEELALERGLKVDHSTIHRWVIEYAPQLEEAFHSAEATVAGIELHHMLRKGQHQRSANETIFEQFYGLAA